MNSLSIVCVCLFNINNNNILSQLDFGPVIVLEYGLKRFLFRSYTKAVVKKNLR